MASRNRRWADGYHAGYHRSVFDSSRTDDVEYNIGYSVGIADRVEDEEAIKLGEFDLLTEEERLWIYGDESDQP
jgi:hypothetical protein